MTKSRPKFKKCRECGTLKRRSPSSLMQEKSNKRAFLENVHLTSSTTNGSVTKAEDHLEKPQEPINLFPPNSTPWNVTPPPKQAPFIGLNRCISEPIYTNEMPFSGTEKGGGLGDSCAKNGQMVVNVLSPENSKTRTTSSSPSNAVVSSLLRSISDPTVAYAPLSHLPRTLPPLSPVSEESPNSKRLKRMKNKIKEMKKWVGEVMKEDDDDEEDHISDLDTDNNSKDETESDHQEAVWVEKKGEGLVIHFKCPCGEGYEIFLFGNNCYYKLM
ncbi:hypothetical protein Leryth_001951 [Lithospermum erythrorhizon]|nr:hypothetical protein Leryth_001951 [Lithospermum erythrorhizon]